MQTPHALHPAGKISRTLAGLAMAITLRAHATPADDAKIVAALDTQYQAAVERNDDATMARILAEDFTLVTGRGRVFTRAELIEGAKKKSVIYEHQVEDPGTQTVRVWGDTAVVTARLWIKGQSDGKPLDYRLWFSDTYIRTPPGWRYAFGQASLPLPREGAK
jgi:ketosteroid isomerase-like protein